MSVIEIPFLTVEVAFAIVWVIARAVVCLRKGSVDWRSEAMLLLMYVNLAVILRFSFFPFGTIDGHVQPLLFSTGRILPPRVNLVPFAHILQHDTPRDAALNILGNVGLYIPSGIILPILYRHLDSPGKVVATGALMSLCVEIVQLLFYVRGTDVDDLILNTLGCAIGCCLYFLCRHRRHKGEETT